MSKTKYVIGMFTFLTLLLMGGNFYADQIQEGTNLIFAEEIDYNDKDDSSYTSLPDTGDVNINQFPRLDDPYKGGGLPFGTAVTRGAKTTKHSSSTASSLPTHNTALSSKDLIQNGAIKQRRYYDSTGKAYKDIDYFHGGVGHTFPHFHYWNWSRTVPRSGAIPIES
ncbi:hypothetical protein [Piscibacillus halophilus]|uniref:hypothetical protein n=1 Tax=Piscibacillus halophilus TaxID=571933 RepID=UPI0015884E50|nr:hypothetical protein [Piscibacillus halophilus]